jgi:diguanylate cyclase (GGDEF)-like protein
MAQEDGSLDPNDLVNPLERRNCAVVQVPGRPGDVTGMRGRRQEGRGGRVPPGSGGGLRSLGPLALSLAVSGAAALLALGPVRGLPVRPEQLRMPWPALVVAFAATVVLRVHFQFRREVHSVTMAEIPLVLGLYLADPFSLVQARLLGCGAALLLLAHQRGRKLLFNSGLFVLEACVASLLFAWLLGGRAAAGGAGLLASFGAVLVADVLSGLLVIGAISLQEGVPRLGQVGQVLLTGVVAAATNTSLALVAVVVLVHDRQTAWLLLVVAAVLFLAYRAYASLREQHQRLRLLHQFTRIVGRSDDFRSVMAAILAQACDLLRAERAEITLLARGGQGRVRSALVAGGEVATSIVPDDEAWPALLERAAAGGPRVLTSRQVDPALGQALRRRGVTDAAAAPLHDAQGTIGTLLVANRLGDVATFGDQDKVLLQALAGYASVALEKGRLIDDLRREAVERQHQALHDPLTGLPNRTLFTERVRQAIDQRRGAGSVAVLLLDLDRFKEVNDTLGHHTGDLMLREVGLRLLRGLPVDHFVARLGGDEFGVLAPAVADHEVAVAVARQVQAALDEPFGVAELALEVGGSIGVAVGPAHGTDPAVLLQRADVAMYQAKQAHSQVELYDPARDQYSPRRLALIGELRAAVENAALAVHYQPKAELHGGRVVGVEALLRWPHPTRGPVPPDEFVPIAEHTGLIRPLTSYVLRTALEQCRAWQLDGGTLGMAVNLSARSLSEPGLVDDVDRRLAAAGVAPDLLTLEVTEGHVMSDPDHAVGVLRRLRGLGVHLAIDDFGTGYSSLAYLKQLPVDEVKLDRSFVMHMTSDRHDAAIVRSTIELAHNLGLCVVAEGVEDHSTWDLLADMGCDLAQGYHLARPMPADEVTRWLYAGTGTAPHRLGR